MTDQQINLAIAAHLGITRGIPDFTGDLNEMHEAEKTLTPKNWNNFSENWWNYCKLLRVNDADEAIHATARQRAEAFLRTLGKWEEVQG